MELKEILMKPAVPAISIKMKDIQDVIEALEKITRS